MDGANAKTVVNNIDGEHMMDDLEQVKKDIQEKTDKSYNERIEDALTALKKDASAYLSREGLESYSPKFLEILNNITKLDDTRSVDGVNPYYYEGSHLVYSQFRTLEGIGVFSLVLEANGYSRYSYKKGGATSENNTNGNNTNNKNMN